MRRIVTGLFVAGAIVVGIPQATTSAFAAELYAQCQKDWGNLTGQVEGREFKFLVDPAKVSPDQKKAFEQIWGEVKNVLVKNGVKVTEREKGAFNLTPLVKTFYDTPNMDLWKKGYLIRTTVSYKKGYPQAEMKVIVKRINGPAKTIINSELSLANGKGKASSEDNIGTGPKGNLYSYVEKGIGFKATRADLGEMNLKDFAAYVPQLAKLGLPADTKLVAYPAFGLRARPGVVELPGLDKPTSVSMESWSRVENGKPIVYDYSFGYGGDFNAMTKAHASAEKAVEAIQKDLGQKLGMPDGGKYIGSKVRVLLKQPM